MRRYLTLGFASLGWIFALILILNHGALVALAGAYSPIGFDVVVGGNSQNVQVVSVPAGTANPTPPSGYCEAYSIENGQVVAYAANGSVAYNGTAGTTLHVFVTEPTPCP